jgi:hypothetical protein
MASKAGRHAKHAAVLAAVKARPLGVRAIGMLEALERILATAHAIPNR